MKSSILVLAVFASILASTGVSAQNKQAGGTHESLKGADAGWQELQAVVGQRIPCSDGEAASFACSNIDLLSFLPIDAIGGRRVDGRIVTSLNDIWGWTDPDSGSEYAVVGRSDGTSIVDLTDPENPVYLGSLPSHNGVVSTWRDVKVFDHYALIVADVVGQHGLQIFDLHEVRDVGDAPVQFEETAHSTMFGQAHNIVVNEETAFAYAVGSDGPCPGLLMIDLEDPTNPRYAGCYADPGAGIRSNGYTHDAQCVTYRGPDDDYYGREICLGANETVIQITDVTDKQNPQTISLMAYPNVAYAHQGWLTPDHRYFYQDDELDELGAVRTGNASRTRTLIWDVEDLDEPSFVGVYSGRTPSIDHNQYIVGERAFQANYTSGLRVLDVSNPEDPVEVGFFDTYGPTDSATVNNVTQFNGAWSNYPFFESGNVIVSSINEGLFVVRPTAELGSGSGRAEVPERLRLLPAFPNPFNSETWITLEVDQPQHVRVVVYDARGRQVRELLSEHVSDSGEREILFDASGLASGVYVIRAVGRTAITSTTVMLQK